MQVACLNNAALVALKQEDWESAVRCASRALELTPTFDQPAAAEARAKSLYRRGVAQASRAGWATGGMGDGRRGGMGDGAGWASRAGWATGWLTGERAGNSSRGISILSTSSPMLTTIACHLPNAVFAAELAVPFMTK